MGTMGNNTNQNATELRETFFDSAEKEYFEKLLKNPEERALHCKLLREQSKKLYERALGLIERVEVGEFNEEKMAEVEYTIAHCLAAIEDIQLVLEKEMEPEV